MRQCKKNRKVPSLRSFCLTVVNSQFCISFIKKVLNQKWNNLLLCFISVLINSILTSPNKKMQRSSLIVMHLSVRFLSKSVRFSVWICKMLHEMFCMDENKRSLNHSEKFSPHLFSFNNNWITKRSWGSQQRRIWKIENPYFTDLREREGGKYTRQMNHVARYAIIVNLPTSDNKLTFMATFVYGFSSFISCA